MEARELRIGNLLYYQGSEDVCEVYYIGEDSFDCKTDLGKMNQGAYDPIPLTEAFLEGFGFKFFDFDADDLDSEFEETDSIEIEKFYQIKPEGKSFEYRVSFREHGTHAFSVKFGWSEEGVLCHFKHVHELQNLYFALTGKELQFKPAGLNP